MAVKTTKGEKAKDSIKITNSYQLFPYRLYCDDLTGVIRMHSNAKTKTTTITKRDILITDKMHWLFYNDRTGFYDKKADTSLPFYGSYISKEEHPIRYKRWMHYMYNQYKHLRSEYAVNEKDKVEQLEINFDFEDENENE